MVTRLLVAVCALTGCDRVFGLHDLSVDAGRSIGADAAACRAGMHDEDGDGIPDACDLCPTITSTNSDRDHDGVGDECDPRDGKADELTFYAFQGFDGVSMPSGAMAVNDTLVFGNALTTDMDFDGPERITIQLPSIIEPAERSGVQIELGDEPNKIACEVGQLCAQGQVCGLAYAQERGTPFATPFTPDQVKSVTLGRDGDAVYCAINDLRVDMPGAVLGKAPVAVVVEPGRLAVTNLIVYTEAP